MHLPIKALEAAIAGLLICDGFSRDDAMRIASEHSSPEFASYARRVGSVALTLQAHGLMKDATH